MIDASHPPAKAADNTEQEKAANRRKWRGLTDPATDPAVPTDEELASLFDLHRPFTNASGSGDACRVCDHRWPCPTHRLIAALRASRAEVERLRLAAAWAEGVIEQEWGSNGPTGAREAWERFRSVLDGRTP